MDGEGRVGPFERGSRDIEGAGPLLRPSNLALPPHREESRQALHRRPDSQQGQGTEEDVHRQAHQDSWPPPPRFEGECGLRDLRQDLGV